MAEETYTPAEAARKLGVSERWLRDRQRAGRVPYHRYGREVRFTETDVEAIQKAHARPARRTARV